MTFLLTIFFFIIIIGFLVFIHELGHFTAAKLTGVGVKEFAIGFGRKIYSHRFRGTDYRLNLIPFGGYVQLEGEEEDSGPGSFRTKPYYAKFLVLTAGVLMNLIFAVIFLTFFLSSQNYRFVIPKYTDYQFSNTKSQFEYFPFTVLEVKENSEWAKSLEVNDKIVGINGELFDSSDDFSNALDKYQDQVVTLSLVNLDNFRLEEKETTIKLTNEEGIFPVKISEVQKGGRSEGKLNKNEIIVSINGENIKSDSDFFNKINQNQEKNTVFGIVKEDGTFEERSITLGKKSETGAILDVTLSYDYGIGVSYDSELNKPIYFIKYNSNLISGASMTYDMFIYQFKVLGVMLGDAFESGDYSEVSKSVGGLPTLGNEVNNVVEFGAFDYLIPLTAFISLSLATVNILPFPALDGGQLLIATIEFISRRKIPDKFVKRLNFLGFMFLISLSILITAKDIAQLGWVESIGDRIKEAFGR